MATAEGLAAVSGLVNQGQEQANLFNKQQVAKQAAELFKAGDIAGAYSALASADPEFAQKIGPQIAQINPQLQQSLSQAQSQGGTQGQLEAQTAFGSNPRQMLDAQIEAGKFDKQAAAANPKEERLGKQFNQQMGFKYQQAAESSPTYKSAIGVINEIPQLKALLDDAYKNGGQSLAMLGPRIAKGLAGEVGVLTEADVTRYVRNPAVAQWIISGAEKKFEGKLTPQDYSNLMRLGVVMQENAEKKLQKAYEQAATKMSRNLGIPLEDAQLLVNPTIDEPTKKIIEGQHSSIITPKETFTGAPKAGMVIDGFKFKGGDPADQKNWEKVK